MADRGSGGPASTATLEPAMTVYDASRRGLPPLRPYVQDLWRRRQFVYELSRSTLHSQHFDSVFGQIWLILNPLLLGAVYYVLVAIIGGSARDLDFFAHLVGALFAFYFVSNSMTAGVSSVTGGGRLILNTYFPRSLLPLSAVIQALMRFLPTLVVYAAIHAIAGLPVGWHLISVVPLVLLMTVFGLGLAMFFGALQVLFRDTASFLPYFNRVWLYLSPVLWLPEEVPQKLELLVRFNPLYPILGEWADVLVEGRWLDPGQFAYGAAWAVGTFLIGGWFFLRREREFAVRL